MSDEKANNADESAVPSVLSKANAASFSDQQIEIPPTEQSPDGHEYISGFRLAAVTGSVTLVAFLMLLDMSIIGTAIPKITTEFSSLDDVGWYGAAYNLASGALQPLTGKIYTYFRSKWTFVSFLFVFAVGSLICGVAPSSKALIIGRAVAGLGTSGLQNGAMTIISNSVPLEKRPALLGILIGFSQLGIIIGPLLGGAITEYSTWRWCFYINLPAAAVVAAILAVVHIPERHVKLDQSVVHIVLTNFDLPGFTLFAPAAIIFLLGLEYGGTTYPWNSATVIGLLVGSVVMFVIFFVWENRQGDKAMFPLGMIKKREIWTSMLAGMFLLSGTVFIVAFYLPIYFQAVKGVSPFTSGLYVLPNILSALLFGVLSGLLVQKFGYYVPWVLFGGGLSAVACGLLTTLSPSTETGKWIGYQILLGARGASLQMPMVAIQAVLPQSQISIAMALLVFAQTFGGAVFLSIAQSIFGNSLSSLLSQHFPVLGVSKIINAGAAGFRSVVSADDLPTVLEAYSDSIDRVLYMSLASSICLFLAAWGMGWHDIRKKKEPVEGDA